MPDGTVYKVKQKYVTLKANAIPSIFPKYPKYYAIQSKKPRKLTSRKKVVSKKKKEKKIPNLASVIDLQETSFTLEF